MSVVAFSWTVRARPLVEIGIGDIRGPTPLAGLWDGARWDGATDAQWGGDDPTFRDVSCFAHRFECASGRSKTIERFIAGTATVLVDNASGWADPNPSVEPGRLWMRPGRQIRFGIDHRELGRVWLWRGFIDAVVPRYDPVEPEVVELHCVDALGEVGRAKFKPLAAPCPAESADLRVHRILDAAGQPPGKRDVTPTGDRLLGHDLGGQAADLLGQTGDSVGGAVFGDQNNNVCFRGRDWATWSPGTPPDATIGNVDPADVCPSHWTRPFERADIATRIIVGRDAETALQVDDIDAAVRYGIEPFERTNLLTESDTRLAELADRIAVVRNEQYAPRVRAVELDAATADEALDLMTTVNPFKPSRYRCRLQLARGLVFDDEYFATGFHHIVTADQWTTAINLDVASPYAAPSPRWDGADWGEGTWGDVVARGPARPRPLEVPAWA